MVGIISLHIFCVLRRSGAYANESGFMRTASPHISCVLRWLGISFIQHEIFESRWSRPSIILPKNLFPLNALIFYLYHWAQARVKFYGQNADHFKKIVTRYKKVHVYVHNFSVSFFSSSERHQSHHLDGCQAIRINSSFIFAFWALRFL